MKKKFVSFAFSWYQRLPCMLKSFISRAVFKPKLGRSVGLYGNILYGPDVSIGDYSYIHRDSYVSNVEIGKFCSIGKGFSVITSNHNYKNFSTYLFFHQLNSPLRGMEKPDANSDIIDGIPGRDGKTVIGNDVWIGENVFVMRGVKIGGGSVIGACSFVNTDVPPYHIAAGVPCRIVKPRFSPEIVEKLTALSWWDWSPEEIYARYKELVAISGGEAGG